MNDTELRLAELLRLATPEPPSEISLATLQAARTSALSTGVTEAPRRSAVRRWLPLIAAGAVAASIAAVVGVVGLADDGHPKTPAASTGAAPTSAPTAPVAGCRAEQMSGSVLIRSTDGAGRSLVVVGLTNTSSSTCSLRGYAEVFALGSLGAPLDGTTFSNGTHELPDPGPSDVTLAPRATASFGLEATTTYPQPVQSVTELRITLPANSSSTVVVPLNPVLFANGPAGQAIPFGLTAYQLASSTATFSSPPTSSPTSSSPTASSNSPTGSSTCRPSDLAVSSGGYDRGAGQLYFTVVVKNTGATACTLSGFPTDVLPYSSTSGSAGAIAAKVTENGDSNGAVSLAPGAAGSFVFHGANAYDGPAVTIQRLVFALPGTGGGSFTVALPDGGMSPNGPTGQPLPVDVTALQAGMSR